MLIQSYFPRLGGAERQLASLAPLLEKHGAQIRIFTRRYDRALSPFEKVGGVPVYRLPVPGPKPLAALSFSTAAMPLLREFKPHLIHAHELLSPATTAVIAKRIFGVPVVAKVLRGGELGDLAKLKKRTFGARRIETIKRGTDAFIVISREIDSELEQVGVPPEQRVFIPNGVDLNRFAPPFPEEKTAVRRSLNLPDGLIAVFSGRLDPEKRVGQLINTWRELVGRYPDATLLILGTGVEEAGLKRIAAPNVRFEGVVGDVSPYFRASDVFVLPSSTEGLSNSLLEAMASGLALVATSVGGATDLVETGKSGILIQPDDPQAILSALTDLFESSGLRARLGANARRRVEREYSLSVVAEKLNSLYRKFAPRAKWK